MTLIILNYIVLISAITIDSFATSFGYATNKITIPWTSTIIISFVCTFTLLLSISAGMLFSNIIPENIIVLTAFILLFTLGIIKLFDHFIKAKINKSKDLHKNIVFNVWNLKFVLNIYANPELADLDRSKTLSWKEASYLAIALSLDGLAVGFGIGLLNVNIWLIAVLALIINILAILIGNWFGRFITKNINLDLGWASGVTLIIIAISLLL